MDATPPRWSRFERWIFAGLVLVTGVGLVWVAHPYYDEVNDAALYVLTGRSLATGEGYRYLGEPFLVRPPGLAWLLAPLLAGERADFAALNTVVAAFGAAGALLVFVLFRPRLGGPLAAALSLAVAANPTWQRVSSQVLSDVPGATLCLAILALEPWVRRHPSWTRHLLLGLALTVAVYVRTMNVLLIPALALGRLIGPRADGARAWKPLALALALPILAYVPWIVRTARAEVALPPEQLLLHSYWTALWHVDPGDPSSATIGLAELVARSGRQLEQTLIVLGRRMAETGGVLGAKIVAGALLGLLTLELVRRRSAVELVTAAFGAVLVAYFVLRPRLVLPLWLFAVPIGVQGLAAILDRYARSDAGRRRVRGALAIAVLALAAFDAAPRTWLDDVAVRDADRRRAADVLRREVPSGEPIVAVRGWHWGVHLLDRPVWSLQYLAQREGTLSAYHTLVDRLRPRAVALDVTSPVGRVVHEMLKASRPPLARGGPFAIHRVAR